MPQDAGCAFSYVQCFAPLSLHSTFKAHYKCKVVIILIVRQLLIGSLPIAKNSICLHLFAKITAIDQTALFVKMLHYCGNLANSQN